MYLESFSQFSNFLPFAGGDDEKRLVGLRLASAAGKKRIRGLGKIVFSRLLPSSRYQAEGGRRESATFQTPPSPCPFLYDTH